MDGHWADRIIITV